MKIPHQYHCCTCHWCFGFSLGCLCNTLAYRLDAMTTIMRQNTRAESVSHTNTASVQLIQVSTGLELQVMKEFTRGRARRAVSAQLFCIFYSLCTSSQPSTSLIAIMPQSKLLVLTAWPLLETSFCGNRF